MPSLHRLTASRVDEAFDSWVAWRAACMAVDEAYRRWSTAPKLERPLAFGRYRAALEQEEQYADLHARASAVAACAA